MGLPDLCAWDCVLDGENVGNGEVNGEVNREGNQNGYGDYMGLIDDGVVQLFYPSYAPILRQKANR